MAMGNPSVQVVVAGPTAPSAARAPPRPGDAAMGCVGSKPEADKDDKAKEMKGVSNGECLAPPPSPPPLALGASAGAARTRCVAPWPSSGRLGRSGT